VAAPVADRAWALERWFHYLERQTVQPHAFAFVATDTGDGTVGALRCGWAEVAVQVAREQYIPRERRQQDLRFFTEQIAMLRNRLMQLALSMHPTHIFSLDTDIMLTDPTTIERLLEACDWCPLAAPMVSLSEHFPCYNAAQWFSRDPGPTRAWRRLEPSDEFLADATWIPVDIPMAAVMMRSWVPEGCSYGYHEAGEDMGFALSLDRHGFRTAWLPHVETVHVMQPARLAEMLA